MIQKGCPMKALRFSKFGAMSVLSIGEVPMPQPGAGEALVRVAAAAINPSDLKNVAGHFKETTLPRTPGRDFAGVVERGVGWEGKSVWGSVPRLGVTRDGSHAEYVVVPIAALSVVPRGLSMEQAAAIGVPFVTAWYAVVNTAQIQSGETILIIGAGGAVGQATTQVANWKNARVFGGGRGADPIPGTVATIDTGSGVLREKVFALTNGRGVDVVLDTVGGPMFEPALRCLKPGGRQVAISSTNDRRVSFDLVDFYHNRSRLLGVDTQALTPQDVAAIAEDLRPGFESGALKVAEIDAVPFDRAVEAYEKVAKGAVRRKQVLVFASGSK
jgi:NADPH:quinone reductase-like Zn-dependent oxidoreductase